MIPRSASLIVLLVSLLHSPVPAAETPHVLWYKKPAGQWTEALPIGNGRLGAMIYGGVNEETLSLNEDTLYSGEPGPCGVPKIHEHVDRAFELIQAGKYAEAEKIVIENMLGRNHQTYTTLGSLRLRFDHEKRDRSNSSERPEGCFAQVAPVPFFASEILGGSVNVDSMSGGAPPYASGPSSHDRAIARQARPCHARAWNRDGIAQGGRAAHQYELPLGSHNPLPWVADLC